MESREKAIDDIHEEIARALHDKPVYVAGLSAFIITIPSLEAYFREKFENEPGRLVAEKGCDCYTVDGSPREDCPKCYGKRFKDKRRMTRKEVEEWAYKIALYHGQMHYCMPLDGERVIVEE